MASEEGMDIEMTFRKQTPGEMCWPPFRLARYLANPILTGWPIHMLNITTG